MSTILRPLSLRELTREYTRGSIDRQTYRQRRSRLLDELASYTPPHSTRLRQPPPASVPRDQITPSLKREKRSRSIIIVPLVILSLLLMAILLYIYFILPAATDAESPFSPSGELFSEPPRLNHTTHSPQASEQVLRSKATLR